MRDVKTALGMRRMRAGVLVALVLVALMGGLGASLAQVVGCSTAQRSCVPTAAISAGTPVAASSGNVAAATATATLPGVAGKTTYITGFTMTAGGSTAVSSVSCTVSPVGSGGATLSYTFSSSATVDAPSNPLAVTFTPPLPAPLARILHQHLRAFSRSANRGEAST